MNTIAAYATVSNKSSASDNMNTIAAYATVSNKSSASDNMNTIAAYAAVSSKASAVASITYRMTCIWNSVLVLLSLQKLCCWMFRIYGGTRRWGWRHC